MIDLLEPIFRSDWAPYGEGLQCGRAPEGAIPLVRLIEEPDALREILLRQSRVYGCADLRPVASAWCMHYLAVLLPPALAASTVLQRRFPLAAPQVAVDLGSDGAASSFYIKDLGVELIGAPTLLRYGSLIDDHLAPLFHALARATRIPLKILWSNAARRMTLLFDEALSLADGFAPVAEDRACLLEEPEWPRARPNPLHDPVSLRCGDVNAQDECAALHRDCCLNYRLPGEGFCDRCPLDPVHQRRSTAAA